MNNTDSMSISLTAALSAVGVPAANHDLIREFTTAVGIADHHYVNQTGKPYVVATRLDGGLPLHIYYGATNGFHSEEEIIRMAGSAVDRRKSGSRKGTWCVEHPVNQSRPPGPRSKDVRREGAFCACGMQRSVTGECPSCD